MNLLLLPKINTIAAAKYNSCDPPLSVNHKKACFTPSLVFFY